MASPTMSEDQKKLALLMRKRARVRKLSAELKKIADEILEKHGRDSGTREDLDLCLFQFEGDITRKISNLQKSRKER